MSLEPSLEGVGDGVGELDDSARERGDFIAELEEEVSEWGVGRDKLSVREGRKAAGERALAALQDRRRDEHDADAVGNADGERDGGGNSGRARAEARNFQGQLGANAAARQSSGHSSALRCAQGTVQDADCDVPCVQCPE